MRESNPTFILRNWIAQDAIDAAEKGNYSEVNLKLWLNWFKNKADSRPMINFYQSYIVAFLEWFPCINLIILSLDLLSIFKIHGECACYTPVHKCDSRYYSDLFERPSLQKYNSPDHLVHDSNFIFVYPHFNTFYVHFHFFIQRWTLSCSCWRNRSQRSLVRSDLQI